MNLKDIIDLAKAGYKPNDVKELIALADAHEQRKEEPKEEPKDEPEDEPKDEPEDEPKDDEKEKEILDLKSQVKKLQDENTRKDVSPDVKSDADILADFVRGFM